MPATIGENIKDLRQKKLITHMYELSVPTV